jgi:hypothetical protein
MSANRMRSGRAKVAGQVFVRDIGGKLLFGFSAPLRAATSSAGRADAWVLRDHLTVRACITFNRAPG